jgi:hypothetical protein
MNLRNTESRLLTILNNADGWLPGDQLEDMRSLVRAGEPGVALENFCTQLEEYDFVVPNDVVAELREIARLMGMTIPPWIDRGVRA